MPVLGANFTWCEGRGSIMITSATKMGLGFRGFGLFWFLGFRSIRVSGTLGAVELQTTHVPYGGVCGRSAFSLQIQDLYRPYSKF